MLWIMRSLKVLLRLLFKVQYYSIYKPTKSKYGWVFSGKYKLIPMTEVLKNVSGCTVTMFAN